MAYNTDLIPDRVLTPTTHDLPANFPSHAFDPDQLDLLAEWWHNWLTSSMDALRDALTIPQPDRIAPTGIRNFIYNAVILANMLRLHPAAENSLAAIAKELGLRQSDMHEIRREILRVIATRRKITPYVLARPNFKILAQLYPQLDIARRVGKHPTFIIPFHGKPTLATQWQTVLLLARHQGLTATLALMPNTDEDAIRLTHTTHKLF